MKRDCTFVWGDNTEKGILLPQRCASGHVFKCVLSLPEGIPPAEVPFLWTTAAYPPREKTILVLYYDGSMSMAYGEEGDTDPGSTRLRARVTEAELEKRLALLEQQNQGQSLEIGTGMALRRIPVSEMPEEASTFHEN